MSEAKITATKVADRNNVVHTVIGGNGGHCKEVCPECPWRKDRTGSFPALAFVHSAETAYDMAQNTFACHMAGPDEPKTCAGFLLRCADDNLIVRLHRARGDMMEVRETVKLHKSYRAMAIANGVPKDHPALYRCMPEARDNFMKERKSRKQV